MIQTIFFFIRKIQGIKPTEKPFFLFLNSFSGLAFAGQILSKLNNLHLFNDTSHPDMTWVRVMTQALPNNDMLCMYSRYQIYDEA